MGPKAYARMIGNNLNHGATLKNEVVLETWQVNSARGI
jgi:hypothetical protein